MTQAISRPAPSMAEKIDSIDALCARARIMPVITIAREEDILPLATPWMPAACRYWKSPCARPMV